MFEKKAAPEPDKEKMDSGPADEKKPGKAARWLEKGKGYLHLGK